MSRGDRTPSKTDKTPAQDRSSKGQQQSSTRSHRPAPVERDSAARAFFTGGRWTSPDGRVQVGFLGARVQAQNDKIAHRTEVLATGADGKRAALELHGKHEAAGARLTRDDRGQVSGVLLPYSSAKTEREAGTLSSSGLAEGRQLTPSQARTLAAPSKLGKSDIAAARDQIQGFRPNTLKPSTRRNYEQKIDRMARENKRPEEITGTQKSFYAMRAAAIFGAKTDIKQGLAERARAYKSGDKPSAILAEDRIRKGVETLARYPVGGTKAENLQRENVITVRQKQSENSNGKRDAIADRDPNWRDKVFDQARPADRDVLAIMGATGARPEELHKGVAVEKSANGDLTFHIKGAKVDGERGYPDRHITVSRETLSQSSGGRHILARVDEKGGQLFAKDRGNGDAFSERVHAAGESAGINGVSGYDYRHQFASDQKAAGVDRETIAQALGQRSERSQGEYGRASYGSGGGISGASTA